jgi:predicted DNA-binding protein
VQDPAVIKILFDSNRNSVIRINEGKKQARMACSVDAEFKEKFEELARQLGIEPAVLLQKYAIKGYLEDLKDLTLIEKYGCKETEVIL